MARHLRSERWRSIGLLLVLMAGTVLVVSLVERGHDPVSRVEPGDVDALHLPPSGEPLILLQPGPNGSYAATAVDPEDGSRLWHLPLPGQPTDWALSGDTLAISLPHPREAALLVHIPTGEVQEEVQPGGVVRRVAVSPTHLAVAVQTTGNPTVLYERTGPSLREGGRFLHRGLVLDMALDGDLLATGTRAGEVLLVDADGPTVRFNRSVPFLVQGLDLSSGGEHLLLGGRSFSDTGNGVLELHQVLGEDAPRVLWSVGNAATPPVGLVELSRSGSRAVATLEVPGNYHVLAVEDGEVTGREGTGGLLTRGQLARGIALSPDGRWVAGATLEGDVVLRSMPTLRTVWSWDASGATSVDFAEAAPELFAANARLAPGGGFGSVSVFDVDSESFLDDASRLLPALLLVEAVTGVLVVLARGSDRRH